MFKPKQEMQPSHARQFFSRLAFSRTRHHHNIRRQAEQLGRGRRKAEDLPAPLCVVGCGTCAGAGVCDGDKDGGGNIARRLIPALHEILVRA